MCNKAADACLLALKFVPDWLVTNETKKVDDFLFSNNNIVITSCHIF